MNTCSGRAGMLESLQYSDVKLLKLQVRATPKAKGVVAPVTPAEDTATYHGD